MSLIMQKPGIHFAHTTSRVNPVEILILPGVQLQLGTFSAKFGSVHQVNGAVSQRDLFIHRIAEVHMGRFFTGAVLLFRLNGSKRNIIVSCVQSLRRLKKKKKTGSLPHIIIGTHCKDSFFFFFLKKRFKNKSTCW